MQPISMKIGIVLPSAPSYSETFFTSKIKGLEAHGHTIVLFINAKTNATSLTSVIKVAPNLSGNFVNVTVISSWSLIKSILFHFSATKKMYQLDSKEGFSFGRKIKNIIINSHLLSEKLDWLHFGFGTMVFDRENVAEAIGAKMAVSFRGFDHYVYPKKNKNCYALLFSKKVKYHVLSEGMKRDLIQNGILSNDIVKISPAIDSDLFSNNFQNKNTVLEIVTIARLHWIKGLDYTLEALSMVNQKGIHFHYTIIGDGNDKERLQFMVHQLGLADRISFAGKLSPEEVKNKLQTADLYLQYSNQEGFCNAVLEAQAMGKICIVSDAEGLSENVLDTITGFVVPKRNPLSLANKIMEVLRLSEVEKNTIKANAVARVKTHFTIQQQIAAFIKFYSNN
jgi:glycosyltransferase involved in cell wall biosynthesis